MRSNLKYMLVAGLLGTLVISSCSKKIDDAYANPNAATQEPVEVILPAMIGTIIGNSSGASNSFGLAGDIINTGRYIQYWNNWTRTTADNGGTQFDQMGGVIGSGTNMINMWGCYYFSMGANLSRIMDWGAADKKWDYVGAAHALRAWSLFEATNEYGDMIVTQAFNTSLQQFNYDDQSVAYDSVRSNCYMAIDFLSRTGDGMNPTNFGNSDFYFNKGDLGKWKKFVYGILARSYAVLNNKSTYNADSVIYYAKLSCANNADNIAVSFQNTGISGTKNYFGSFRGNINSSTTAIRQSAFIANLMSGANATVYNGVPDPRAWYVLRENPNGTFKGYSPSFTSAINPVLTTVGDSSGSFLGTLYQTTIYPSPETGRYIYRDAASWPIMTASEMQLILAEAYLRKSDFINAKANYVSAIGLNFDMLSSNYAVNIPVGKEINATNKANYLANTAVVPTAATSMTLTLIMMQKYICLYAWGTQDTWTDMRRYHYIGLDPATGQQVYAGFIPPTSANGNLWNGTGSNQGGFVYRIRPSYNSEYIYNIPALTSVGAYPPNGIYHTKEMWFSKP